VRIGCSSSLKYKPTIAELCLPLFLIVEQLKDDYDYEYYDDDEYDNDKGNNNDEFDPIFLPTTKQQRQEKPTLTYDEIESLYEVLEDGLDQIIEELSPKNNDKKIKKKKENNDINFKRLSSSFKSLVGTKVVNKWKRNRAEL
jgi:hypothetical protein